jgi:hypothetical protein
VPSTVTAPVTARIRLEDVAGLRACATRTGSTPSRIVARLVRRAVENHPDLFEPVPGGAGAEGRADGA